MELGNQEIQELIELGTKSVKKYKFEVSGKKKEIKWSPISHQEARMAYFRALQYVGEQAREYISKPADDREGLERPAVEEFLLFNYYHAVLSIVPAMMKHYPGVTVEQVKALPIDHDVFHREIAIASGILEGQENVGKFPDKSSS